MKANQEIRQKIEFFGIRYWQIAKKIGHSSEYFSKLMRYELKPELKEKVLQAINDIVKERAQEYARQVNG